MFSVVVIVRVISDLSEAQNAIVKLFNLELFKSKEAQKKENGIGQMEISTKNQSKHTITVYSGM